MTASSTTHFLYDHDIFVMTEADGAVVFNQRKSEFLSIVPSGTFSKDIFSLLQLLSHCSSDETVQIFEMGSSSPGALLREAWESFEENDPRADELIRTLQFKDKVGRELKALCLLHCTPPYCDSPLVNWCGARGNDRGQYGVWGSDAEASHEGASQTKLSTE